MVDPAFSASSASKPAGADPVRDAFGLESRSRLTPLLHESKERAKLRRHRDILPDADRRGGTRIRRTPTRTCLIRFSAFIRVKNALRSGTRVAAYAAPTANAVAAGGGRGVR